MFRAKRGATKFQNGRTTEVPYLAVLIDSMQRRPIVEARAAG
jgi:hypothetical protein